MLFSIGRERVTWRASKLNEPLGQAKLANPLGRQQLEQDEGSYERSALQNGCSCSPTVVNTEEQISSAIKGLAVLQKASICSIYWQNHVKFTAAVCRSLLCSRADFHVTVLTASGWFSDTIYHLERLVSRPIFFLFFFITEYFLPLFNCFKRMRCFNEKQSYKFTQNCTVRRRLSKFNYTFHFHFRINLQTAYQKKSLLFL